MIYSLNKEQADAVVNGDGAVLVIAGAGSGKTRVLTHRVVYLIKEKNINPYNILAITFTNKAANEMKDRIVHMTEYSEGLWMCTFHSMCVRILRADIDKIGFDKKFSIYSDVESQRVIKRIINEMNLQNLDKKDILSEISWAKEKALSPSQYKDIKPGDSLYAEIYRRYEEALYDSNALDFDDLLLKTVRLFVEVPDVLSKYQQRFKYILIDEFQDTNKIQYTLVKLLGQYHKNVFAVGDEDQSIYGWRGANIGNIADFKKDFKDIKVFKLEQNYRSYGHILKCANVLIDNNSERIRKNLWTDKGDGYEVIYKCLRSDRDEADYVINNIASLMRAGHKFSDFAILVRANSLTRLFEEGLNLYGYPYKVFGGYKFYERKEVKDLIAYLRIISNPKDNEAILRVINFPKRGIGDKAIEEISYFSASKEQPLIDTILSIGNNQAISNAVVNKITPFKNLLINLINASLTMNLSEMIDYVIKEVGFLALFNKESSEDRDRLDNIEELVSAIKQYHKDNRDATVTDFLQSVSLMSDTDNIGDGQEITIATIHSAKGLEFRVVFVVGLEEGIFPSEMSIMNKSNLEEERRVMYVAATRAKERLFLTSANCRYRFNQIQNLIPSRFVREMGFSEQRRNVTRPADNYGVRNIPSLTVNNKFSAVITEKEQKDLTKFKTGTKVYHNRFGEGIIIEMKSDVVAAIAFKGLGIKEFNLEIAPIKVAGE